MPAPNSEINLQLRQLFDAAILILVLWLSHWIRFGLNDVGDFPAIGDFAQFAWLIVVILPFAPLVLELHGFYDHLLEKTLRRSLGQILQSMVWLGCIVGCCVVFLRLDLPSRAVPLIFVPLGTVALLLIERFFVWVMRRQAAKGVLSERVILVGTTEELPNLEESLKDGPPLAFEIVARFDVEKEPVTQLVRLMHEHSVTRVIFSGGGSHLGHIEEAIQACDIEGVEAWLVADFIRTANSLPFWSNLNGRPVLVFSSKPSAEWALFGKRVLDVTGALIGLIVFAPLFLVVAILIKRSSSGPILFRQDRGGQHGYPFSMLKFRTMYSDAEQRRAELLAYNEMAGPVFKVTNDPRITPIGQWLRKTSIDELPQLWNVLRGEMSLVGPRPLPVYEVEQFEDMAHRRRLSVKPGITCLWQISGRNEVTDFEDWVRLDLEYIDNWSLLLDLRILIGTIPVVLRGRGAS